MSDPAPTTSEIVARHGIAWMGISGAWHLGHPQPGKGRDDYRKEAR